LLYSAYKSTSGPEDFAPYTQFVSSISTKIKENNEDRSGIKVAPNPASDIVRVTASNNEPGEITLSNSFGEAVLHQSFLEGKTELDLTQFPEGLYTLIIRQLESTQCKKIMVIH
jgi:hypothetical protein